MEEIRVYFETCKTYWIRQGFSEEIATSRAFWWDCVEGWDIDKSWTDEKRKFAEQYRNLPKPE